MPQLLPSAVRAAPPPHGETYAAARSRLFREGYYEGVPPHLSDGAKRIDVAICKRARCGRCRRRGMIYRPFHRLSERRCCGVCRCNGRCEPLLPDDARYAVLATCPTCGYAEEF